MSKLINRPEDLVQQSLSGLLLRNGHLARLDGFPGVRIYKSLKLEVIFGVVMRRCYFSADQGGV